MQRKHPKSIPEDACENWSDEHRKIANHETDIGDLCDDCYEVLIYIADGEKEEHDQT